MYIFNSVCLSAVLLFTIDGEIKVIIMLYKFYEALIKIFNKIIIVVNTTRNFYENFVLLPADDEDDNDVAGK